MSSVGAQAVDIIILVLKPVYKPDFFIIYINELAKFCLAGAMVGVYWWIPVTVGT